MRTTTLLLATMSLLTACSLSSEDEGATNEDAYRSRPNGNDLSAGSLLVKAPNGANVAGTGVTILTRAGGTKPVGEESTGIPIGRVGFKVSASIPGGSLAGTEMNVPITSATRTEVTLGGLALKMRGAPATFGRGGSPIRGDLKNSPEQANGSATFGLDNDVGVLLTPAGDYVFSWGITDGIVVKVAQGAIKTIDSWDYSQRAVARIVPAAKELPEGCLQAGKATLSTTRGGGGTVDISQPFEIGENPSVVSALGGAPNPLQFTLRVACATESVPVPLGAVGAGPKEFKLGRLDVDDVEVTMSNGTKQKVRGSYTVFNPDTNAPVLNVNPPTNTGVDLAPGRYKVVVTYPTSAGTTGKFEEIFTTP